MSNQDSREFFIHTEKLVSIPEDADPRFEQGESNGEIISKLPPTKEEFLAVYGDVRLSHPDLYEQILEQAKHIYEAVESVKPAKTFADFIADYNRDMACAYESVGRMIQEYRALEQELEVMRREHATPVNWVVHGCVERIEGGQRIVQIVEDDAARFWSVYFVDAEEREWCVADFTYKDDAELFARSKEAANG